MKNKASSIGFKIIMPVVLVITIGAVFLMTSVMLNVTSHWTENTRERVENDRKIVLSLMNQKIQFADKGAKYAKQIIEEDFAQRLERTPDSSANDILHSLSAKLDNICKNTRTGFTVNSIAIFDTSRKIVSSEKYYIDSIGNFLLDKGFRGVQASGYYLTKDEELMAVTVYPLFYNMEVYAVVQVGISLSSDTFVKSIPETAGCDFTIMHNDKRIQSSIFGVRDTIIQEFIYDAIKDSDEPWTGKIPVGDEDYIASYWKLAGTDDVYLFVGEKYSYMMKAIYSINIYVLVIELIVNIVVAVIIILLLRRFVLKPVKSTNKAIWNLSSGEADLTVRLKSKGNDEIAQLSQGVNKFMEQLQAIIKQLVISAQQIQTKVIDLGAVSQQTASATSQIKANIQSVKNQSKTQTDAVSNTKVIIDDSNTSMQQLKDNITAQSSEVIESASVIEELIGNTNSVSESTKKMAESFKELTSLISKGSEKVRACANVIEEISSKSQGLTAANNTIKSIASQTNLLAMNAMIESAHAGVAGTGFAVVAEEIRNLAESSSAQAQSISEAVQEITELIASGTSLAAESQTSLNSIDGQMNVVEPIVIQISNAMEEQSSGSAQVLEALSSMKHESILVGDSSKELEDGISGIQKDMQDVSNISTIVSQSMDEMAAGSEQIAQATQNVSDLALDTKEELAKIVELIAKFKV